MNKKIKRNGFVEGTMIAYAAIVLSKLIGSLLFHPFYAIIGERGGVVYSCAYNIYNLFFNHFHLRNSHRHKHYNQRIQLS